MSDSKANSGTEYRLAYERLHDLLCVGLGSKELVANPEAVSFVSCLFSYAMSKTFIEKYNSIFRDYYAVKDQDALITRIRYFISDMIEGVSREALELGVSRRYVDTYFSRTLRGDLSHTASILANKDAAQYASSDDLVREASRDLLRFMGNALKAAMEQKEGGSTFQRDLVYLATTIVVLVTALVAVLI